MCNCGNSNCCNGIPIGKQGPAGATGAAGSNGQYGGFSSRWLFSTTTSSNPSSTTLRLNNSSPASATLIYVNETNADSTNVQPFLNSFSNGGSFGLIRIFKEFNSAVFADYQVGLVVDSGSYFSIGVTYVSGSGSFAANDSVVLSFAANGAAGAPGTNGQDGVAIIDTLTYDPDTQNNVTGGGVDSLFGSPASYVQITSGTADRWMTANKDGLFFQMVVAGNIFNADMTNCKLGVKINSVSNLGGAVVASEFIFSYPNGDDVAAPYYHIQGQVTRVSATTIRVHATMIASNASISGQFISSYFISGGVGIDARSSGVCETYMDIVCPTFSSSTYLIPFAASSNADDFSLIFFSVWGLKKV